MDDLSTNGARGAGRPGRRVAAAVSVLGVGFVLGPLLMGMFSKAPQGAEMLADFTPFMTAQRLSGFSEHLDVIDRAVAELDAAGAARTSASYADFSRQWPVIDEDMSGLMDEVAGNLGNYRAVAALPSFRVFPWLFAVPGALLVVAGGWTLVRGRWTAPALVLTAAVGIGLVAVPVATSMFSRAPRGAEMMGAFRTLETEENVARIQGYFSTMAVGQGAIRLEVVPALGAADLPATTRLNDDWVGILNDMTPMIGAMSDNVGRYDAISSMPDFRLFPWAFLVPGVLVLGLAVLAGRSTSLRTAGDSR